MKRFKNILYILDQNSFGARSSAEKVATLARLNEACVTVLIAHDHGFMDDLSLKISGRFAEIKQAMYQQEHRELEDFLNHAHWNTVNVTAEQPERTDFLSIIEKVLRDGHDLVIKEEDVERGIDQLTMRLIRKCPCPVWVVKRNSRDFRRILATLDVGSEHPETCALNQKIVELTYSLAQREKGEAHYLHVWRLEHETMMRHPRFQIAEEEILEMKAKLKKERGEKMHRLLAHNQIQQQNDHIHIREGLTAEVIRKIITERDVDVVIMGSVGRSGIPGLLIGNTAEKLLHTINCTVLTVKPDGFVSPVTLS